jgi:hypothetical protein
MRSEAMRHIHRAWRNPALPLLNFESVAPMSEANSPSGDQGLDAGPKPPPEAGTETGLGVVAPGMEMSEANEVTRWEASLPAHRRNTENVRLP